MTRRIALRGLSIRVTAIYSAQTRGSGRASRVTNRKAIVLDLDGTLLNSEKKVSARDAEIVLECLRLGHLIVMATARPLRTVVSFVPQGLLQGHLVLCNGAWTVKDRRILYRDEIPHALVRQVLAALTARGLKPAIEAQDRFYADPAEPRDMPWEYLPLAKYPITEACKVLAPPSERR